MSTNLTRRTALGLLAAPAIIGRVQAAGRLLRIPHQLPRGTGDCGDFHNRRCEPFAGLVQERTGGPPECQVRPVLAQGLAGFHDV